MPSYTEQAARDKLALAEAQKGQAFANDSFLARRLKKLQRKDFSQEIQPTYTTVEHTAGEDFVKQKVSVWGKMGVSRTGKIGTSLTQTKGSMMGGYAPELLINAGKKGSMEVVSPEMKWTTEGYLANSATPENIYTEPEFKYNEQDTGRLRGKFKKRAQNIK